MKLRKKVEYCGNEMNLIDDTEEFNSNSDSD